MQRRTGSWLLVLMLAFSLTACSGSDEKKPEQTKESSVETPLPELDDVRKETYEDYSFAGYKGTMEICYREEALFYQKWNLSLDKKKKAKKAYEAVCAQFTSENGAGEEANAGDGSLLSTSWKTGTEDITAQMTAGDAGYSVSFQITETQ